MQGRMGLKAGTVVTLAVLIAASSSAIAASANESDEEVISLETAANLDDGNYIVFLDEAPAATYEGGEAGLAPTKPDEGEKLDATAPEVVEYSEFLETRQAEVAAAAGVTAETQLTITSNAFATTLTASQAAKLATTPGVRAVLPDEILHPDAVPSTEFLGLSGSGGVWEATGGAEHAGEGVVVGVIDTGIAPENPSFAGAELGTTPSTTDPYLEGNTVVFNKSDGTQFRSERASGENWDNADYTTKLIGAKYFVAGAERSGHDFEIESKSPRDADGHGSHTASTAAGNHDVDTTVGGMPFGKMSGVAPAAKVAAYKACWAGPDPLDDQDDTCAGSDLLAAINEATKDGVDVINYSIGGGSATSVYSADDEAFRNAAAAGIFVSVSAGNSGPNPATADHASPWYTTVAASTIPTYEGTVVTATGEQFAGASVSVPAGTTVAGSFVYAGDIKLASATDTAAQLCLPDALDPAKAAGKIVLCDRGENARADKSANVKTAGGIGMVLVNVTPGSLDNDFHTVPTVHVDADARDTLLAYARTADATVTLHPTNLTGSVTPTPVVAGFSSRGPMLADGSDILKPDISAPGVNILAAEFNNLGDAPNWGLKSGTSMSSPHIAGLGALYLGERPNATPAEIKSAMMTTAYNTVNADGTPNTDPFAQGAGHVDPKKFFNAGLLYLNGPADWQAFLKGKGLIDDANVVGIDGSDLNLPSIAIGTLTGNQTITRTVTATTAGTYTAKVDVAGVSSTVTPSTITLAAGESATFTVDFTNNGAPVEEWTTGFLTWSNAEAGIDVRSPIAIMPTTADAPDEVAGRGVIGNVSYQITPGSTQDLDVKLSGLTPLVLMKTQADPAPGHTGNETTAKRTQWLIEIKEGTTFSRFDLNSSDDEASDLDLTVMRVDGPEPTRALQQWQSATASADERVDLWEPTAGWYILQVDIYSFEKPFTFDFNTALVAPGQEGNLTATPNPIAGQQNVKADVKLAWRALTPHQKYIGTAQYGDQVEGTVLTVDSGPKGPGNTKKPAITGDPVVGNTLAVDTGEWDEDGLTFQYEWLRNGQPIASSTAGGSTNAAGAKTKAAAVTAATGATYVPTDGDVGQQLTVNVTAVNAEGVASDVVTTDPVTVVAAPVDPNNPTNPTPTPTTTSGTGGGGNGGDDNLANTGQDGMVPVVLFGLLIIAAGGGVYLVGRSRRQA